MNKKLAGAAVAAVGVAALGLGGTYAGFTATEETPVLVEAGTLELSLTDRQGAVTDAVEFSDLAPGDEPSRYFVRLTNDGTVPATAQWAFVDVSNRENGCLAPEGAASDTSCTTGDDVGELGSQLEVTFAQMGNPNCTGGAARVGPRHFPADSVREFFDIQAGTAPRLALDPGQTACVRIVIRFPELGDENNLAQSDVTRFRFDFRLDQKF